MGWETLELPKKLNMSNYKTATQLKLRFTTRKGELTTEQLWDLSLTELDTLTVELETLSGQATKKSFLVEKAEEEKIAKLRFDIAFDILTTKIDEVNKWKNAEEVKKHNQKILSLIANKQDENLLSKTADELKEMLK